MKALDSIYFLLLCGIFASLFYILHKSYYHNKKNFLITLLFPPYLLIYAFNNFQEIKEAFFYILIFLGITLAIGLISNEPYIQQTLKILFYTFFWQVAIIEFIK